LENSSLKRCWSDKDIEFIKGAAEVVPRISEYANTQNKVNAADFFANHPYHVRMQEFSRRMWAPSREGQPRQFKWFYERARGQYLDAQAHLTLGDKKKFTGEFPKDQMFAKTDLAKFENAWEGCPHIVSRGAQKNFAAFASDIGKKWDKDETYFNELYFKQAVARAIVFRTTEKLIMKQPWYGGGYRANIVVYTIAWLAEKVARMKMSVDFLKIWEKQTVSDIFYKTLEDVSFQIQQIITDTPASISNVTEWCKKDGCWLRVKAFDDIELSSAFLKELIGLDERAAVEKDAKKIQKVDDGITCQKLVLEIGPEQWKEISKFGLNNQFLNEKDIGILRVAVSMPARIPSESQCKHLIKLLERLKEEGLHLN
jgi:hypothetical protein